MSDEERTEPEHADSGVFGKLPSTRPGVRSPRRVSEREKERFAGAPEESEAAPGQVREAPATPPDPEPASPRVRPSDTSGRSSSSSTPTQPESTSGPAREAGATSEPEVPAADGPGVEDLAWAGITVAAEAATLGVRLLSRALGAVRGAGDRR
jgi:hypothetical protein